MILIKTVPSPANVLLCASIRNVESNVKRDLLVIQIVALQLSHVPLKRWNVLCGYTPLRTNFKGVSCKIVNV